MTFKARVTTRIADALRRALRGPRELTTSREYRGRMGVARRQGGFDGPVSRLEGLDAFAGKWVAVKDGAVVAVADSSRALVYEVHKLGAAGKGAVAQYVAPPSGSAMVGVG